MEDGLKLHFVSSAIAGFIAVIGGSPADVVKSRCIDGIKQKDGSFKPYTNIRQCAGMLYREQGFKGFYAGFNANVNRLVLWNIIMFVTREQIKMRLKKMK